MANSNKTHIKINSQKEDLIHNETTEVTKGFWEDVKAKMRHSDLVKVQIGNCIVSMPRKQFERDYPDRAYIPFEI